MGLKPRPAEATTRYAARLPADAQGELARHTELLSSASRSEYQAYVHDVLRPKMPSQSYAKNVRVNWEPAFIKDHGYRGQESEFRGLHVAKPSRFEWLREQSFAFHIVKFSLHSKSVSLLRGFPARCRP